MNAHVNDYNFLMSTMPEIEIYNTIIQSIDTKETFDNFFDAFPVLKLFCKYTNFNYVYIGTFDVKSNYAVLFNYEYRPPTYIWCNEHMNVFECNKFYSFTIVNNSLLINEDNLYMISSLNEIIKIISFYTQRSGFQPSKNFIDMIRKHKYITDEMLFNVKIEN